jgi:glycosyltransferase involved in cell wall biosynthesis
METNYHMSRSQQRHDATDAKHRTFRGASVPDAPLLSIITPAYDAMPYLVDAIASVEQLASHVALEHVVADGASNDGSIEVLASADYVCGLSQPDEGLYDALNWALGHARGRYVQWLNADDLLCPKFTCRAVELLEANDRIDFVLGSTLFVGADGELEESWSYDPFRAGDLWSRAQGYFFNINSAVYRRDLLLEIGEFDQANYPIAADLDFELRLIARGVEPVVLDEPAYVFRRHEGSQTSGHGAEETVMRTGQRLFKRWSQDERLDTSLRRAFFERAVELRLGWSLKRLAMSGRRQAAVRDLCALLLSDPKGFGTALTSWLNRKLRGEFVPMSMGAPKH